MEKITSGLPPFSLPLYSPSHHYPSPPNTQTLISHFYPNISAPFWINPPSIRCIVLLLHLLLLSSLSLSLLSILRYPFCCLARGSTESVDLGRFQQDHFTLQLEALLSFHVTDFANI